MPLVLSSLPGLPPPTDCWVRTLELKWLLGVDCVRRTELGTEGEARGVGGRSEVGWTELVCLYELLLGDRGGGWASLEGAGGTKLGWWPTAGGDGLVGLQGGDGGESVGARARGHELNTGTEGLARCLVTGGQTEVTGHLDTQTVGLQVLLTESPPTGSPDVSLLLHHALSESKE